MQECIGAEARRSQVGRERLCVFNLTRQSFLSLGVSVADTPWTRLRGLLGWRLRNDEGLWVVPSRGIHTVGLLCTIDVVYLDADLRVIHTIEYCRPFHVGPLRRRSSSVLELPARSVFCSDTRIGDQLLVCSPGELAAYWSAQEAQRHTDGVTSYVESPRKRRCQPEPQT